jgi:ketosteroid isomerase-like protein
MDAKHQTEGVPRWLYRADTVADTEPSRDLHAFTEDIRAEVWSPQASDEQPQWTTALKKKTSVLSFLEELQHHLRKITSPRETYLVSMTPNLEWAIHRTGQKCRRGSQFHKPGQSALAVIDTHELSGTEGTIALRVTDIIAYADAHSMKDMFDAEVRKWAANCDEYVAINVIPSTALVKWIPWSDLYRPDLPQCLIPEPFTTWYTLGLWRQKLEKDDSPLHQVAKRIANFAQRIVEAGPPNTNLGHDDAISLIAHASDWGYKAANDRSRLVSAAMLHAKINAMVEEFDRLYVQV